MFGIDMLSILFIYTSYCFVAHNMILKIDGQTFKYYNYMFGIDMLSILFIYTSYCFVAHNMILKIDVSIC